MDLSIVIFICLLLLLAYLFDFTAAKTKIPAVILLLLLGWSAKYVVSALHLQYQDLGVYLPYLGTFGLLLIVLEGSMDLTVSKSQKTLIGKSALIALLPLLFMSFGLACVFHYAFGCSYKTGLANAIPFAIISSAIAIPSVRNMKKSYKDFITYESSLSDIYGVVFFNFITLNDNIEYDSFAVFLIEMLDMVVISVLSTLVLAYLLSRIRHHVKYTPIIILIVLIYTISKQFHLPALLFVLIFGLFLNNIHLFNRFEIIKKIRPEKLNTELPKFREIIAEFTFLVRSLFFLLFGFLIDTNQLFQKESAIWALGICIAIYTIKAIHLKLLKIKVFPLVFIAPRGLITILLFISIPASEMIPKVNNALVLQVIVFTVLIMMLGVIGVRKEKIKSLVMDN